MKSSFSALLLTCLLLVGVVYSADSTMSGTRIHDTYLNQTSTANRTYNYGSKTYVYVGHSDNDDPNPLRRGVITCDLPHNMITCDSAVIFLHFGNNTVSQSLDIFLMDTNRTWSTMTGSSDGVTENGAMCWNDFYYPDSSWTGGDGYYYTTDTLGSQLYVSASADYTTLSKKLNQSVIQSLMLSDSISEFGMIIMSHDTSESSTGYYSIYSLEHASAYHPAVIFYGVDTIISKETQSQSLVEDCEITQDLGHTDNNFGGSQYLKVQFSIMGGAKSLFRVKDVDTLIGDGMEIVACTLSVYVHQVSSSGTISAYSIFKPWGEGTLNDANPADAATGEGVATANDWSNDDEEWGSVGCGSADDNGSDNSGDGTGADRKATAESSISVSSTGWVKIPISASLAQSWYDGTKNEEGVCLVGTSNINVLLRSSEYSTADNRPKWSFYYKKETASSSMTYYDGVKHNPAGLAPKHRIEGLTEEHRP